MAKKRKMTKARKIRCRSIVSKLKRKKRIRTPYALAMWMVKRGKGKRKRK